MRECIECGDLFDPRSQVKRRVGGLAGTCPDCSVEPTVKYVGVQAGDGKQSQAAILKFDSRRDAQAYMSYFQRSTGFHKGKVCHLSGALPATPNLSFKTLQDIRPHNHKGRA